MCQTGRNSTLYAALAHNTSLGEIFTPLQLTNHSAVITSWQSSNKYSGFTCILKENHNSSGWLGVSMQQVSRGTCCRQEVQSMTDISGCRFGIVRWRQWMMKHACVGHVLSPTHASKSCTADLHVDRQSVQSFTLSCQCSQFRRCGSKWPSDSHYIVYTVHQDARIYGVSGTEIQESCRNANGCGVNPEQELLHGSRRNANKKRIPKHLYWGAVAIRRCLCAVHMNNMLTPTQSVQLMLRLNNTQCVRIVVSTALTILHKPFWSLAICCFDSSSAFLLWLSSPSSFAWRSKQHFNINRTSTPYPWLHKQTTTVITTS